MALIDRIAGIERVEDRELRERVFDVERIFVGVNLGREIEDIGLGCLAEG